VHHTSFTCRNPCSQEIISVSKDTLPGYEQKLKSFYEEHIHDDEEIRYILDGCGGCILGCIQNACGHYACPSKEVQT